MLSKSYAYLADSVVYKLNPFLLRNSTFNYEMMSCCTWHESIHYYTFTFFVGAQREVEKRSKLYLVGIANE